MLHEHITYYFWLNEQGLIYPMKNVLNYYD